MCFANAEARDLMYQIYIIYIIAQLQICTKWILEWKEQKSPLNNTGCGIDRRCMMQEGRGWSILLSDLNAFGNIDLGRGWGISSSHGEGDHGTNDDQCDAYRGHDVVLGSSVHRAIRGERYGEREWVKWRTLGSCTMSYLKVVSSAIVRSCSINPEIHVAIASQNVATPMLACTGTMAERQLYVLFSQQSIKRNLRRDW